MVKANPQNPAVTVNYEDGVATVRFNRPEAMNAIDLATKESLLKILCQVAQDPDIRCVVITGSGHAFCVGQDLKEHVVGLASGSEELAATVTAHYNPVAELIATMDKPVIAAVNGVAAGAGAAFVMACDLRIFSTGAGVNLAFAGIALSCDSGTSFWLPRLVGVAKAHELLYFPRTLPAEECLALGLATSVVPEEEFDAEVTRTAHALAEGPTRAYGAMRRSLAFAQGHDLAASLAFEAEQMRATGSSSDHRAAVDAFLAKERPAFTGH
ncbi:2-(1,2-epoxy-1,2-dihydrophenyl)acetyl-CoA isomerase [Austwickia chelonae]|uniref:Putative enoyl-CoA hydratase n=1 Tax=Austwickia chelonae NBRC 105200 TaxID=1184607 RepID=K6V7N7_9MICO|nr:enoyl-CoA hydratase-related protein [Austwickia chelonae]GAB78243.1 putative enoyl-CoA hydratase [Austwickia chelonae NBRC 105200]SEV99480.1 2-(1,2-epoxy-1,2-dihydrophenyl)acetyl-CoA isomerase [Austwickia chelonae]